MISPELYHQLPKSAKFMYAFRLVEIVEGAFNSDTVGIGYSQSKADAQRTIKILKKTNENREFVIMPV